jgi:hypothetical protein
MSTLNKGSRVTLTFREKGPTGRPTLTVDVSAESDILPHEHRHDLREIAAEVMGVPLATLEGVEVELRRVSDHEHTHDHEHEHAHELPQPAQPNAPLKA